MSMSESKQAYYEKLVYNELMTRELVNSNFRNTII